MLRGERGLQVLTFCVYDILLVIGLVYLMPGSVGTQPSIIKRFLLETILSFTIFCLARGSQECLLGKSWGSPRMTPTSQK